MIVTVKGNLLDAYDTVMVHCVNCQGVMGGGIAREIKERFPGAFELYHKIYEQGMLTLGSVSYYPIEEQNSYIANAAGQDFYGTDRVHVDYDATRYAFLQINAYMEQFFSPQGIKSVSFPLFGCGLAGGDWNIVSDIIDNAISDEWKKFLYVL